MNIIQKYLDQNDITRYKISKLTGISNTTLQSAVTSKNGINGLTGKVIIAIAKALNKTPGTVLDEIIELENQK
ncbi:MAG: helix-turn-helix transcriptional regulator [Lactobacillus sp.]|nr:helix-turn-helix transcriptional regulator [Lactobacillus sp.]